MSKACRRPTFAAEEVLSSYRAKQETLTSNESTTEPSSAQGQPYFLDSLVLPSGWVISSHHDKILNESSLTALTREIKSSLVYSFPSLDNAEKASWITEDSLNINNRKLHLPPMLFGKDIFQMRVGSGVLSVTATDALLCWAAQHTEEAIEKHPLDVVKVPYAAKWTARMAGSFGVGTGTNAAATTTPAGPNAGLDSSSSDKVTVSNISNTTINSTTGTSTSPVSEDTKTITSTAVAMDASVVSAVAASDWTYSSDYVCTLHTLNSTGVALRARQLPISGEELATGLSSVEAVPYTAERIANQDPIAGGKWTVRSSDSSGVDYELLKRQDEPILFYDEFLFYQLSSAFTYCPKMHVLQDDLEDCGEIVFEGKVRVMPSCWFLLCKQFLRVDGVLVRCRETRLFHKFVAGAGDCSVTAYGNGVNCRSLPVSMEVHMEVCWRELRLPSTVAAALSSVPVACTTGSLSSVPIIPALATGSNVAASIACVRPPPPASTGSSSSSVNGSNTSTSINIRGGASRPSQHLPAAVRSCEPALASTHPLFTTQGKSMTHLLPLINEQEGISQFYTLTFTESA